MYQEQVISWKHYDETLDEGRFVFECILAGNLQAFNLPHVVDLFYVLRHSGPHLQTPPIPVPQQSEPHPFSPHNPLSHIDDSSL